MSPPPTQLGCWNISPVSWGLQSSPGNVCEHREPPCLRRSQYPADRGTKSDLLSAAWKASEGSPKFQGLPQDWPRTQWKTASSSLLETRQPSRAKSYWSPTEAMRACQENRGAVYRLGGGQQDLDNACWQGAEAHAKEGVTQKPEWGSWVFRFHRRHLMLAQSSRKGLSPSAGQLPWQGTW